MRLLACVAASVFIVCVGCASISEGTIQAKRKVLITSIPSNALVTYGGVPQGRTPMHLSVSPGFAELDIRVDHVGYVSATLDVKDGAKAAILGNIIFGGLIGVALDLASGSVIGTKEGIHVVLEEVQEPGKPN